MGYDLNNLLGASHLLEYILVHIQFDFEGMFANSIEPEWLPSY